MISFRTQVFLFCLFGALELFGPPASGAEILAPAGLSRSVAQQPNGPDIVFDRETLSFGQVPAGVVLGLEFRFHNPGTATLQILSVKPACGCTTSGQYDQQVLPGRYGKIPLRFDTRGMQGSVRRFVNVKTNVAQREYIQLWLEGRVEVPFDLNPPALIFGLLDPTAPVVERVLHLQRAYHAPIPIAGLESESPLFRPVLRTLVAGDEYEVRVTASSNTTPGAYTSRIKLLTTLPEFSVITIPVSAFVPPPIDVRPAQLVLPKTALPTDWEKIVSVRFWQSQPRTLIAASCTLPGLAPRVELLEKGKAYQVRLTFPKGFVLPASGGAKLVMQTDDPTQAEIEVPIQGDGWNQTVPEAR